MWTRLFLLSFLLLACYSQTDDQFRSAPKGPLSGGRRRGVPGVVVYPPGARVINVKTDYFAAGDGIKDDTAAIVQAIRDHADNTDEILYFPNGKYLVSSTLEWKDANG